MKQNFALFIGTFLAAGLLSACGDGAAGKIYLAAGSQGQAGDGAVYGLEPGAMYLLQNGRNWHPVKSDGTLGPVLVQLNRPEVSNAVIAGNLAPLDAGVTAVTGLDNDMRANVYKYWKPADEFLINAWNATGGEANVAATYQRNTVTDLSGLGSYSRTYAWFGLDVTDAKSELIFITPDVDNIPQEGIFDGGSPRIAGGSEWEYRFDGGMAGVSASRPLRVKVSAAAGQKGYFTLSGGMPPRMTIVSKRTSSDYDKPNPR
jgi:hypothetical protein